MISDVLSESTEEIRWYLNKMPEAYASVKPRIDQLLQDMDALRLYLDTPPQPEKNDEPPSASNKTAIPNSTS